MDANKYNSRIIIACDFASKAELKAFLAKMSDKKLFLKLGMQILYHEGFSLIKELKALGHHVFVDLKIHDIPHTAAMAAQSLKQYEPDFLTIHALGGLEMMKAVMKQVEGTNIKILAVTILTSMDEQAIKALNINKPLHEEVQDLMHLAKSAGVEYVVCSAHEAKDAKQIGLQAVTPGIRLEGDATHDQARVMTPEAAFENGSTFIVLGRSITNASNPLAVYEQVGRDVEWKVLRNTY